MEPRVGDCQGSNRVKRGEASRGDHSHSRLQSILMEYSGQERLRSVRTFEE